MKTKLPLLFLALCMFILSSCTKEGVDVTYHYYGSEEDYEMISSVLNLPATPLPYINEFPSYYTGFNSPFDKDLATLGRVLFYDKKLSSDGTISCASCHDQKAGFADNRALSLGVENRETTRNSLALGSVFSFNEYYGSISFGRVPFFWDNRANSVQEQAVQTFANEREMNMNMTQVVDAVNSQEFYRPLFRVAFGEEVATEQHVLDAVSIFVNSIGSFNSKYDDVLSAYFEANEDLTGIATADLTNYGLTAIENTGKNLYITNCASCHGETNGFPGLVQANNGLDMEYDDPGVGGITNNTDNGIFKVPTLRNITLTGPYMHDGRFETLDDVLEHYSNNVQNHPNLSNELKENGVPKQFNFSAEEKAALIAFLNTFTDEKMANAEKFSDPFRL